MSAPRAVATPGEARAACDAARARGDRVGFVPTMGALHAGHLALVAEARRRAAFVVVSIFVNPTQFAPTEDLSRYPRDLDGDLRKLAGVAPDLVFAPDPSAVYPPGDATRVRVGSLAAPLEGVFRPTHFEGVATVVAKLFSIVGPSVGVFGRKDYQQLAVVRRMTRDLFLPVDVVGHPIVREPDGLAMSSRNAYLSPEERVRALAISGGLDAAARRYGAGERDPRALEAVVRTSLEPSADTVEYVEARTADELAPIAGAITAPALLAVACRIGKTRLIDNLVLGEDPPPLTGEGPR
ncbi:MAG: pantoate--beta-alanine ligase [Myxococcales bacterium]|nr:pantoate--beta-alanine ligase [Myxococcales bacterium]